MILGWERDRHHAASLGFPSETSAPDGRWQGQVLPLLNWAGSPNTPPVAPSEHFRGSELRGRLGGLPRSTWCDPNAAPQKPRSAAALCWLGMPMNLPCAPASGG